MIVRVTTGCVFTGVYDREHAYQSWSIEDHRIAAQRPKVVCRKALRKTHPPSSFHWEYSLHTKLDSWLWNFLVETSLHYLIAYGTLHTNYSQISTPSYATVVILARAISVEGSVAIGRL